MLKACTKKTIIIFLLVLASSQSVYAEVNLYRYDGKLPFIRMMLGMMDAMGVIDKLPANSVSGYGGNSYSRYANNPMLRSPWSQSPWVQAGQYGTPGASPIWGSPEWGVQPVDRYTRGYYDQYGYDGSGFSPYWSQTELDGWVEEPWEVSSWNAKAHKPRPATRQVTRPQPVQQPPQQPGNVPLVQNFNFAAPENSGGERPVNRSPLARIARSGQPDRRPPMNSGRAPGRQSANQPMKQPMRQPMNQPVGQYGKPSPLAKKRYQQLSQKPCVTEFCGLKKPNLNGLWVSQDGEMLGINNHRYLWSDGSSRYLTGQIKVQNEYLVTSVDDHDKLIRFKYKLAANNLLTMQPDGTIREFKKMSRSQYQYFNSRGQAQNYSR